MLTIENLPLEEGQSIAVDLGEGIVGTITCVGYQGGTPIYRLSVGSTELFIGTAESLLVQVASYRRTGTLQPGLTRYKLEQRVTPTPFGNRTDTEWVVVDE